jgi:hypothetical protein
VLQLYCAVECSSFITLLCAQLFCCAVKHSASLLGCHAQLLLHCPMLTSLLSLCALIIFIVSMGALINSSRPPGLLIILSGPTGLFIQFAPLHAQASLRRRALSFFVAPSSAQLLHWAVKRSNSSALLHAHIFVEPSRTHHLCCVEGRTHQFITVAGLAHHLIAAYGPVHLICATCVSLIFAPLFLLAIY